MAENRWDRLDEVARSLAQQARAAQAQAAAARGSDPSATVTVALNAEGRVDGMAVAADWRDRLRGSGLPDAVRAAVQAATAARLEAWARAIGDPRLAAPPIADPELDVAARFAGRLQEAATAQPSPENDQAALGELLGILQQVEQGLDRVSEQLETTLSRAVHGYSQDRKVSVTLSGGGDLRQIHYDRRWLRQAHGPSIGRRTLAALRDAYAQLDQSGVAKLIADGPLGQAQQAVQDPFGLARRMRLTD